MRSARNTTASWNPPHVAVSGCRALVEEVEQVLLQFILLDELRHDKTSRAPLSISANTVRMPHPCLTLDHEDSAEDVEAQGCSSSFAAAAESTSATIAASSG
jgi:hypothetical protein